MDSEHPAATQIVADPSRRRIAELTRERDSALASAASERERVAVAIRQCDQLAAEVFAWRKRENRQAEVHAAAQGASRQRELDSQQREQELRQREHDLTHQLAFARATIAKMESSRFWQLRLLSVRLRRLIGR
jgi:hypothetical protein